MAVAASTARNAASPRAQISRRSSTMLLDLRVEVDEDAAEPVGDLADHRLAGAHEADERDMAIKRVERCFYVQPIRSRYARCAATKSPSASPPNFSFAARASSQATAASATTASASTAWTSPSSTSACPARRSRDRPSAAGASRSAAVSSRRARRRARRSRRPPRCRRRGSWRAPSGLDLVVRLRAAASRKGQPLAHLTALTPWIRTSAAAIHPSRRSPASRTSRARAEPRADHLHDAASVSRSPRGVRRSTISSSPWRRRFDRRGLQRRPRSRRAGPWRPRRQRRGRRCGAHCSLQGPACVLVREPSVPARSAPRAGERHGLRSPPGRLALGLPGRHAPRPVGVVAVVHHERKRRAERASVAQAGEHLDRIGLELPPRSA